MNLIEKIMLGSQIFGGCDNAQYVRLFKAYKKYPQFIDVVYNPVELQTLIETALSNGDITSEDVDHLRTKGII